MDNLLPRKELSYLVDWGNRFKRKPLVIRGARQVGKSTLVHQFSLTSKLQLIEINFERNPEYKQAFTTNDPAQIVATLQLMLSKKINDDNTLLFLDEIQAAPEALVALRYFYEEMPNLRLVAAGSLLEFTLADAQFSMPVGRIEYLHLGPMQFEDFISALGHTELKEYFQQLTLKDITENSRSKNKITENSIIDNSISQNKLSHYNISEAVHNKCMALLKQYWIIGGLPESVAQFALTNDYSEVVRIQQNMVATYRDDFNKYSHGKLKQLVQMVFDQLPVMVGKKFKYANVSRDHRAAELSDALQHLCLARVAAKVYHSSGNGIPLAAEVNHRLFKTLYLDIGLMSAALNLNLLDFNKGDLSMINNGEQAEQFIGQHLMYSQSFNKAPELYYWVREAKSASAEVDYLITCGQRVIPVEIKAGTSGSLKSLHQFLKEKKHHLALRFNAARPSLLSDTKQLTDGSQLSYKLLSLPLYLVEQAPRLLKNF